MCPQTNANHGAPVSRYLIWIGSDQEKTFGPTISGLIHKHIGPERMCLWDSKARGTSKGTDTVRSRPVVVLTLYSALLSQAAAQT